MSERKHFYLITEHEEEARVGGVSVFESRMTTPTKNEEGAIQVRDTETKTYMTVGKKVGLGYHDFEDEQEYEATVLEVMKKKIREVDEKWAEKAGVVDTVYGDADE